MDPKDSEPQASSPSQKEEKKINYTDLEAAQPIVNEYAKGLAVGYRINPDDIYVNLVTSGRGISYVRGGPIVEIDLLWPDAAPHINTLLKDAFTNIRKFSLKESVAIVPFALVRSQNLEIKKWKKAIFGELSELFDELIPRRRLRTSYKTTMTVTDSKTGLSVTVECPDRFVETYVENRAWFKLSRLVREYESR